MIPQAVILVGGLGTRLAEQFPDVPKGLVPVNGRPFLEWQLDWLRRGGITKVLLAAGYKGETFEHYFAHRPADGMIVVLSREPKPLGTAGALRFAKGLLAEDPVLILNGDTLVPNLDFSTVWKKVFHSVEKTPEFFHGVENSRVPSPSRETQGEREVYSAVPLPGERGSDRDRSGNSFPRCGKIFVAPIENAGRYGTVEFGADGFVTAFREKAPVAAGFVNAGVYLLPLDVIASIPPGEAVSIERDVFPELVKQRRLAAIPVEPPLLDMGTLDGLAKMEAFLQR